MGLQSGSLIVECLRKYQQPVMVYLPPGAELRGGAWVVIDGQINPRQVAHHAREGYMMKILEQLLVWVDGSLQQSLEWLLVLCNHLAAPASAMAVTLYAIIGARPYLSRAVDACVPSAPGLILGCWLQVEMYADPTARGGVLEPEGIVEIKFRAPDLIKAMHRLDPVIKALKVGPGTLCISSLAPCSTSFQSCL